MADSIIEKVCSKCKQSLPLNHYGSHKTTKDRKEPRCRECRHKIRSRYQSPPDLPGEVWRSVPEAEGAYLISNLGRLKSIVLRRRPRKGEITKGHVNQDGYLRYSMTIPGRPWFAIFAHVLVASAFIGPAPSGCEVNHKDGNKLNNQPDNLEYVTHARNMRHASENQLMAIGERAPHAKLNEWQVRVIRRLREQGWMHKDIGALFGVSSGAIFSIIHRQNWRHV